MTASKETRPTPQSLPKLTIPTGRYVEEPEEITVSRAEDFLEYCQVHKRAPITRIPSFPRTNSGSLGTDSKYSGTTDSSENPKTPSLTYDSCRDDPATLAFTANEWDNLDAKEAELRDAKEKHKEWYTELLAFNKDRNAIQQCKHWRLTRERLNEEIATILRRREIRRLFRKDFNNLGIEVISLDSGAVEVTTIPTFVLGRQPR
ncbi:hypothetical protein Hte_007693 [Hypoxylon texense]